MLDASFPADRCAQCAHRVAAEKEGVSVFVCARVRVQLAKECVLYALRHYEDVTSAFSPAEYYELMGRMVPHLRVSLMEDATKAKNASAVKDEPM